jgi:hypothetical protein
VAAGAVFSPQEAHLIINSGQASYGSASRILGGHEDEMYEMMPFTAV